MIARSSPNQQDRPPGAAIEMLVLHYTGMRSATEALERLCDPAPPTGIPVSCHYLIDEDGAVFALVPEARMARHAGVSFWRGREALNACSVGIEIVNPGHQWGYRDFPPAQIEAVQSLAQAIVARHGIAACDVVGHSDVAPDRKQDPGERFPWRMLAGSGLGLWPTDRPDPGADPDRVRAGLCAIGYRPAETEAGWRQVLEAFQRHWRPEAVTGEADAGTRARLAGLLPGPV